MKKLSLATAMVFAFLISASAQTTWTIDKNHSTIGFSIDHMVISEVDGKFDDFDGSLTSSKDDLTDATISFTAKTASINTGVDRRDNHLRSGDFFDAEKFPEMTFKSSSFKKVSDGKYSMTGDLTIHGITKSVTLDVKFNGTVDTGKGIKAGFKVSGVIMRKDWGLTWNNIIESGGLTVGEEVTLDVKLEMNKS